MDLKDAKVIYVDDNRFNIALIKAFAEEFGINMVTFLDAKKGLDYVLENDVDLVLLDYMMPGINGIEFAKTLKEKKPFVSIIMISAFDDYQVRAQAKKVGIDNFLPKPVDLDNFKKRVVEKIKSMQKHFSGSEVIEKKVLNKNSTVYEIFAKMCLTKDKDYKNIINIANIAKIISSDIKGKEYANKIFQAALFYDIGKNRIPSEILLKPGKLTKEEFELMKTHTSLGYNMLNTEDEILQIAAIMALNHHEKFNAEGYLRGLKGENIPLCARIISIADVFDALVSKKIYKDKISLNEAVNIIMNEKGKSFDPKIVDVFSQHLDEIRLMYL